MAVSENTARTYLSAVRRYQADRRAAGLSEKAWDCGPEDAANWLAHVWESGAIDPATQLTSATLKGYKSAMRNWFLKETSWAHGPNPWESNLVSVVITGLGKDGAERESRSRAKKPQTVLIGPDAIKHLSRVMDPICGSNEQLMIWAAACLASHAMLRPNEFLGTYGLEQRHLRLDQIQFLNDNGIEMHPEAHSPITGGRPPQCFYVNLGVTKADPLAHNKPILVEEPLAVTALWRWMMVRASGLDPGPQLFRQHGDRSLSIARLCKAIALACLQSGWGHCKVSGKCFRRGKASEMVAQGHSAVVINAAARWKTTSTKMILTYADPGAVAARATAAKAGRMPRL